MTSPQDSPQPDLPVELRLDPAVDGGVYANLLSVWHTPHELTLDFATWLPLEGGQPDAPPVRPARVVARVKVAPTLVFAILRTLNEALTGYEQEFGPVHEPQPRPRPQSGG